MKIAITNHHRKLVGGAESYLNGIIPELEQAGHQILLFHEDAVLPKDPVVTASTHTNRWMELASFRANLIFNQGLMSPALEEALSGLAPVAHFAHNYHGTCISGEKTRKLPHASACSRCFGPACLAQYYPRNCGGWNPVAMLHNFRVQGGRLRAMARAKVVVTASRHMQQEYQRNGIENVQIAPLFVSQNAAPLPEPETSSFRILFAGRMTRVKGASLLAAASPLIRNRIARPVEFTFAGDGPDGARVQQLCPEAHFTGWLPQTRLRELAAEHHLFAMPSLWPEPFGLAGLELGLPVAAFRSGGIPDWLTEGENGSLAEPPSPEVFADAILRCSNLPNARGRAHAAAARFTVARHLEILLPILEQACAS